jgi:two-component system, LytTR family, response regulator
MRPRHAVIVDDERLARKELRSLLADAHAGEVHIVGEAASLDEAARLIRATDADLVFLDITLGRESGFDLVPLIGADVEIVFVTAHDAHAVRAFEVNALDFLLKPVDPKRLERTIQRLTPERQTQAEEARPLGKDDRLFLRLDDRRAFVRVADIVAIEAAGDSSLLHLAAQPSPARNSRSLREWEDRLPDQFFIRIHRSTIINLDHVLRVEEWSHSSYLVTMRGLAEPFPMSRRYGARVRALLG